MRKLKGKSERMIFLKKALSKQTTNIQSAVGELWRRCAQQFFAPRTLLQHWVKTKLKIHNYVKIKVVLQLNEIFKKRKKNFPVFKNRKFHLLSPYDIRESFSSFANCQVVLSILKFELKIT
jgi:hypothetical protein